MSDPTFLISVIAANGWLWRYISITISLSLTKQTFFWRKYMLCHVLQNTAFMCLRSVCKIHIDHMGFFTCALILHAQPWCKELKNTATVFNPWTTHHPCSCLTIRLLLPNISAHSVKWIGISSPPQKGHGLFFLLFIKKKRNILASSISDPNTMMQYIFFWQF